MLINRIEGFTREMAKNQPQFLTLPIRDEIAADGTPLMTAQWEFTPQEVAAVQNGAPFMLSVLGTSWPPLLPWIGKPQGVAPDMLSPITTSLAGAAKALQRDMAGKGRASDATWLAQQFDNAVNAAGFTGADRARIFNFLANFVTGCTAANKES